jgi:Tfp pilus assembly protein PilN
MSVKEAIQTLKQIDLLDEENSDILDQLKSMLAEVESNTQQNIKQQVAFLESIAIDFPEGTIFTDEDLY